MEARIEDAMAGTWNGGARYRKGRHCRRQSRDKPAAPRHRLAIADLGTTGRTSVARPSHVRRSARLTSLRFAPIAFAIAL
ncbi:hypothetical protein O4A46_05870 [Cupriavidus gilardii]|uniref:hypothetical protein n=1 Tax=Cupriavidus gilardii TaxID=82541 RepID=UPI00352C5AF0